MNQPDLEKNIDRDVFSPEDVQVAEFQALCARAEDFLGTVDQRNREILIAEGVDPDEFFSRVKHETISDESMDLVQRCVDRAMAEKVDDRRGEEEPVFASIDFNMLSLRA